MRQMGFVIDKNGCRLEVKASSIDVRVRFRGSVSIPFEKVRSVDVSVWRHVETLVVDTSDGFYEWSFGNRTREAADAVRAALDGGRRAALPEAKRSPAETPRPATPQPATPPPQPTGERPGFVHVNLDDAASLARLVRSGAIWTMPPFVQRGVDALESGAVRIEECSAMPEDVSRLLSHLGGPLSTTASIGRPGGDDRSKAQEEAEARRPAPDALDGWSCPEHGREALVTLTAPSGRVYRGCDVAGCREFEGAAAKEAELTAMVAALRQTRLPSPAVPDPAGDPIAGLERLAALRRSGALNEEEFAAAKRQLLGL